MNSRKLYIKALEAALTDNEFATEFCKWIEVNLKDEINHEILSKIYNDNPSNRHESCRDCDHISDSIKP